MKPILKVADSWADRRLIKGIGRSAAPVARRRRRDRRVRCRVVTIVLPKWNFWHHAVRLFSDCRLRQGGIGAAVGVRAKFGQKISIFSGSGRIKLKDVQPAIIVVGVDEPLSIDKHVAGLNDLWPVWSMIHQSGRGRRHECSDLQRAVSIANVEHADSGILLSREDHLGTDDASRADSRGCCVGRSGRPSCR